MGLLMELIFFLMGAAVAVLLSAFIILIAVMIIDVLGDLTWRK